MRKLLAEWVGTLALGVLLVAGPIAQAQEQVRLVPQLGGVAEADSMAFSPDSRVLLTGSGDFFARLWDVTTGKQLRTFSTRVGGYRTEMDDDGIKSTAISPDGRHALTGLAVETLLWDMATGKELRVFKGGGNSVAFSPDGRFVLIGSIDNPARIWDVATGKLLRSFAEHTGGSDSVAFSRDGRYIVTGSINNQIARLWDAATGQLIRSFKGHEGVIACVAFSPKGRYVITGSFDKTARLWDATTGKQIRSFVGHTGRVTFAAFSPDGRSVLTGSEEDGTARLWDAATGQQLRLFGGDYISFALSPDGRLVLAGSFDKTVHVWDAATGQQIRSFEGHTSRVTSVAFSPDGRYMITFSGRGSADPTAGLWDAETGSQIHVFSEEKSGISSAALSPDDSYVLTGSDGTARLRDATTGQLIRPFKEQVRYIASVAFSQDGRYVIAGGHDGVARLWDATTGQLIRLFDPKGSVGTFDLSLFTVAFSLDGRYVLTGGHEPAARLWDAATGLELRSFDANASFFSVALSPDGHYVLAGGQDGAARLWDAATGHLLRSFEQKGPVNSVAFSPDGRNFLSGVGDGRAWLWDAVTGRQLRSFVGHTDEVNSAAFSPDGRFVLTGSDDTTTRLWDAATGKQLATLISSDSGGWTVTDREGRFDTSDFDGGAPLAWVVSSEPMRALPLEIFMRDYYTPRLLARIMNGETLPPIRSIAEITNRVQPDVSIALVTASRTHRGRADVVVHAASHTNEKGQASGLKDLRIFRNGQMVGYLEGELKDGDFTFPDIQLPTSTKTVTLTAYAFNSMNIKSATAQKGYAYEPGAAVKPHAYLLQIGVNHYQASGCELHGSATDAEKLSAILTERLTARGLDVRPVRLISTDTENGATKESIRNALHEFATVATPDDVFFLSFSGHGYGDKNGQFYILPSDVQGSCQGVDDAMLGSAISADELAEWLRPIDAGEMTFILDSCDSASSVEANDFKPGPMGSRGLGQLAYDKRMRILAASQSNQAARESDSLHQGLLSYALAQKGLVEGKADWKPVDQKITVGEWLNYAADEVPKFREAGAVESGKGIEVIGARVSQLKSAQIPAVFDFSKTDTFVLQ